MIDGLTIIYMLSVASIDDDDDDDDGVEVVDGILLYDDTRCEETLGRSYRRPCVTL